MHNKHQNTIDVLTRVSKLQITCNALTIQKQQILQREQGKLVGL